MLCDIDERNNFWFQWHVITHDKKNELLLNGILHATNGKCVRIFIKDEPRSVFLVIERISFEWRQTSASFFRRNTNDVRPHIGSIPSTYVRTHARTVEVWEMWIKRRSNNIAFGFHSIFHFGRNEVHRNNYRPLETLVGCCFVQTSIKSNESLSARLPYSRYNPSNEDLKEGSVQRLSLWHGPHFGRRTFWFSHSPHSTHSDCTNRRTRVESKAEFLSE